MSRFDSCLVERFAVRRERNAIGAVSIVEDTYDYKTVATNGRDGFAPNEGDGLPLYMYLRSVVYVTLGEASTEVNDNDLIAAFGIRVGDVGDALAGSCDARAEIEAEFVEILVV